MERFIVSDGLQTIRRELQFIAKLIVDTACWVHPDTFRALPVWYPETARGRPIFNAAWERQYTNTKQLTGAVSPKYEPNIKAGKALIAALGVRKVPNWTVCHIWGVDDPKFQKSNTIVADPRYYTCVGNMVWLPTPLKAFTDAIPEIKLMLRVCAFHLYGWACDHADVAEQAREVRDGRVPDGYPLQWPTAERRCLPPGTAPFTSEILSAINRRKAELKKLLDEEKFVAFPRQDVREVLRFWAITL